VAPSDAVHFGEIKDAFAIPRKAIEEKSQGRGIRCLNTF